MSCHVLKGTIKRQEQTICRLRLELKQLKSESRPMKLRTISGRDIPESVPSHKVPIRALNGANMTQIIRRIA